MYMVLLSVLHYFSTLSRLKVLFSIFMKRFLEDGEMKSQICYIFFEKYNRPHPITS